jgi:hypothetical protein
VSWLTTLRGGIRHLSGRLKEEFALWRSKAQYKGRDMDTATQTLAQGVRGDKADFEPDLSVDGLSDSILAKLLRLFRLA